MTSHVTASSPERSAQSRRGAAHSKPGGAPILRGGRLTKVAGLVASYAPALGLPGLSLLASASALAIGAGALWGASASVAVATACNTSDNSYFQCTGTITQTQSLTSAAADDLNIFVDSSATFNVASGIGIDINHSGLGGVVFTANEGQSISAAAGAINVENTTSGTVEVTVTGTVAGGTAAGIRVTSTGTGSAVNLGVASVTGSAGIVVTNTGTGDLDISATGQVVGSQSGGVMASNSGGGDVTITAASVSGATYGIKATNEGAGSLSVVVSGSVSGSAGAGIHAESSGSLSISATATVSGESSSGTAIFAIGSGGLTITAATVSGGQRGIYAKNNGSGTLGIVASGTVSGSAGDGIRAESSGSLTISASESISGSGAGGSGIHATGSGALAITAAAVSGGQHGIYAKNTGSGTLSIVASAPVSGSSEDGISAESAGVLSINATSSVSGGRQGIRATNSGIGAVRIVASGSVYGTAEGGIYASGRESVSISAAGSVSGSGTNDHGIHAKGGGALTITAASVSGGSEGIRAENTGTGAVSIVASGSVSGASGAGIHATSSGALSISAAQVTGNGSNGSGIAATSSGALTITATRVSGGQHGIMANNTSTGALSIVASGSVSGASGKGIDATSSGALSISAASSVSGSGNDGSGIAATSSGALTITATRVSGGQHGIMANNTSTGAVSIVASGAVSGASGKGIDATSSGALSISAAQVTGSGGSGSGIAATSSGALAITATVVSGGQHGITARNKGAGDLTITASSVAAASGSGVDARSDGSGDVSINVSGSVAATGGDGISATASGGAVSIQASGSVSSTGNGKKGISARKTGTDGRLEITANGSVTASGMGIEATSSGAATVTAKSTVTSTASHGISVTNTGTANATLTVSAQGTGAITGGMAGIRASAADSGGITINAHRSVTGTGGGGKDGAISVEASGGGTIRIRSTAPLTGERKHGIYAKLSGGSDLDIALSSGAEIVAGVESGAAVTGGGDGIMAVSESGQSETEIAIAKGAKVRATEAGIRLQNNGSETATISANGSVMGGTFGIESRGSGKVSINVAGMVAGGTASSNAAIRTSGTGHTSVTIMSGAVLGVEGGAAAFEDTGGGDSYVAIKSGATVKGELDLGSGADMLFLNGGEFAAAKGGTSGSDIDMLTFESGESNLGEALDGWETITVVAGAIAKIRGDVNVTNLTLKGRLNLSGDGDVSGTTGFDAVEVVNFTGGGVVVIDANFVAGKADTLKITGTVASQTRIDVNKVGGDNNNPIELITVPQNTASNAFRVSENSLYVLELDSQDPTKFVLKQKLNNCDDRGSGVFSCSNTITTQQDLSSGTKVNVTLESGARATLENGIPFNLTQSGAGGIVFRQESSGGKIETRSGRFGISADNNGTSAGAGSVTIRTTGEINVTGPTNSKADTIAGIFVKNAQDGENVSVSASGAIAVARHASDSDDKVYGIHVTNSGSGTTMVAATGSVTATGSSNADAGIYVNAGATGTGLTVTAASVQGGASGIKAMNAGTGNVAVSASGSVTATGTGNDNAGIHVTSMSGAGLAVSASDDVASRAHGIYARLGNGSDGSGALEITAAKRVVAGMVDAQGNASGGGDGIRAFGSANSGSLKVTLGSDASVNATKIGIHAKGSGAGGMELNVGGSVRGGESGIVANNTGSGALELSLSGSVSAMGTGSDSHGIKVTSSGAIDIDLSLGSSVVSKGKAMEITSNQDGAAVEVSANRLDGAAGLIVTKSGGSGKVDVRAGTVLANAGKAINIIHNGSGGVALRLNSATSSSDEAVFVDNDANNAGATYLKIDGEVRSSAKHAISVTGKDNAVTIKVKDAHAAKSGIRVVSTGSGSVAIESKGLIATSSTAHADDAGIFVKTGSGVGENRIVAKSVTIAAKDVEGDYAKGIHVDVDDDRTSPNAGTAVSISVAGKVTGSSHGSDNGAIRVRNKGTTTITLERGARVGAFGSPPRDNADAINTIFTKTQDRRAATGTDTVTVNTGASVVGNVRLGGGEDTLTFDGGDFSDVDVLDGGGACGTGGARRVCIGGYDDNGLPWEQKPYNDRLEFRNLTGSFPASEPAHNRLLNWEVIVFGPGANVRFDGTQTVSTARDNNTNGVASQNNVPLIHNRIILDSRAQLILADGKPDDALTLKTNSVSAAANVVVAGELELAGTVRVDANFDETSTIGLISDKLHLASDLTDDSEVAIAINNLGWSELETEQVMVATVVRDADASKFSVIGGAYRLVVKRREIWVRQIGSIVPSCEESRTGSGVFYCSGHITDSNGESFTPGAAGNLQVTLLGDSSVTASHNGDAIELRGGDKGVAFIQAAPSGGRVQRISGAASGIDATATGNGGIDVTVTGSVTGESDAAIKTATPAGNSVRVMLNSGATVGAKDKHAISDGPGAATVTVNAGARIVGTVNLGAGNDTLVFDGGDFDKDSHFVGGNGTGDRIEFRSGTFRGLKAGRLQQWETIALSSSVTVVGVAGGRGREYDNTFDANLDLAAGAVLSMADNGAAEDVVRVTGNLSSARGIVKIDVDFASQSADRLVVDGSASGTTMIDVSTIGRSLSYEVEVARVSGDVRASAFTLMNPDAYTLEMKPGGSFWIKLSGVPLIAGCLSQGSSGSGVYACSGAIQTAQSLTADHGATMNVTVAEATHVNVSRGNGFDLHQRGSGGIHFTQNDGVIEAADSGIFAKNDGRGPVEVRVLGEVRGGSGRDHAAIKTDSTGGGATRVTLASGADVGRRGANAIIDSGGDTTVTAMAGSKIAGDVELGGGVDALVFDGGDFAEVTRLDGGDGVDTLRFAKGSGTLHADLVSRGLENWERVVVGSGFALSGDVRLAPSSENLVFDGTSLDRLGRLDGGGGNRNRLSFENASGSLKSGNLVGWERIDIGQGADIGLDSGTLDTGRLAVSGRMSLQNASADDALTVEGDFEGGGTVALDAKFAANGGGTADMLRVRGDLAGRATTLQVKNLDPVQSAPTDGSVVLVKVDDRAGVDPAAFRIADGGVPAGAFAYTLAFRTSGLEGGEFHLENIGKVSDTGAILEAGPTVLASGFAKAPTFASRNAARSPAAPAAAGLSEVQDLPGRKAWIRIYSEEIDHGTSANGGKSESSNYGVQLGLDLMTVESGFGDWNVGVTSQFGSMEAEAKAPGGRGTLSASGQGVGAIATWSGARGAYFDGQFQMNWITSEYASTSAGTFVKDSKNTAWVASVESGMRFGLGRGLSAVPQAQLAWGAVNGDSFTTDGGLSVDFGDQASLTARLGAALEMAVGGGSAYLSADVIESPGDPADVDVTGGIIASDLSSTWVELGFGFSIAASSASRVYLDGSYREGVREGMDDESAVSVSSGVRFSW